MEAEKGFQAFFKFVLNRPNLSSLFMIDLPMKPPCGQFSWSHGVRSWDLNRKFKSQDLTP